MIEGLLANNLRWAASHARDDLFKRLSAQAPPRVFWVGCCDCRVPANEMIGLDPGAVFVHRNLANQTDARDLNFLASLEFALDVLSVKHIIVCGHYGCSGVKAALHEESGSLVDQWLLPLHELSHHAALKAIGDSDARANMLCERNVAAQVESLAANPLVRATWSSGRPLSIHGWVFSVHDGLLRDLDVTVQDSQWQQRRTTVSKRSRPPRRRG